MGALASRQNAGVEEVDIVSNHAYKYPPLSGKFGITLIKLDMSASKHQKQKSKLIINF